MRTIMLMMAGWLLCMAASAQKETRIYQFDKPLYRAAYYAEYTPTNRLDEDMNTWLDTHLSDPTLSVDAMAEVMGYRRTIFFKKIKALTGQTPAEYIKTLRMNRAAELLREETITVAEVCYKVGINDPHYFAKVFKQQFGISPKKYQQGGKKESE